MSEVVKEIEMSMGMTKIKIKQLELLKRLENNEDFKEFILDGFCEKHVLGLVYKKVSPNYQDDVNKQYIEGQINAVGHLKMYMRFIHQEGEIAKQALAVAEDERDRAIEEGVA